MILDRRNFIQIIGGLIVVPKFGRWYRPNGKYIYTPKYIYISKAFTQYSVSADTPSSWIISKEMITNAILTPSQIEEIIYSMQERNIPYINK